MNRLYAIHLGRRYRVASIEDAVAKWCAYRDRTRAGVSDIGNGVTVMDSENAFIARVLFDGRIRLTPDEDDYLDIAEAIRIDDLARDSGPSVISSLRVNYAGGAARISRSSAKSKERSGEKPSGGVGAWLESLWKSSRGS